MHNDGTIPAPPSHESASTDVRLHPPVDFTGAVLEEKYWLIRKADEGGNGSIYEGFDILLGRRIAVKVLNSLEATPDTISKFRKEARLASRLDHPNAVPIHDFGISRETPFLVMRYVDGKTLFDLLGEVNFLHLPRAARIFSQICSAVAAAHAAKLIHCDLKTENIMLMKSGEGGDFVQVLDFGLAQCVRAARQQNFIKAGMIYFSGTPEYMSPEQILGEIVDERSDVYSLGIVLYEMLTGDVPFNGDDPPSVLKQQVSRAPLPPSQARPEAKIPNMIDRVIARALNKKQDARYQTVNAFLSDFLSASSLAMLAKEPPPVPQESQKPVEEPGIRDRLARWIKKD